MEKRPDWLKRALDPNTPMTEANETVRTMSVDGKLFPTVRMINGKLVKLGDKAAEDYAMLRNDFIQFETDKQATEFSKQLSRMIGARRNLMQRSKQE